MKEFYNAPEVEIVKFTPAEALASETDSESPVWDVTPTGDADWQI